MKLTLSLWAEYDQHESDEKPPHTTKPFSKEDERVAIEFWRAKVPLTSLSYMYPNKYMGFVFRLFNRFIK
jgi:hypothetical protein